MRLGIGGEELADPDLSERDRGGQALEEQEERGTTSLRTESSVSGPMRLRQCLRVTNREIHGDKG
jgi:hypothetical protein